MNGTTDNTGNCRTGNRSGGDNLNDRPDAIDLRKENNEYERRRKLAEEARKHLLSVQKVLSNKAPEVLHLTTVVVEAEG